MKFVLELCTKFNAMRDSLHYATAGQAGCRSVQVLVPPACLAAVDQGDQLVQICLTCPESMLLDTPVQSNHQMPRFSELRTTSMRASRRCDHRRLIQRMIDPSTSNQARR
jgi:hypothetical protein